MEWYRRLNIFIWTTPSTMNIGLNNGPDIIGRIAGESALSGSRSLTYFIDLAIRKHHVTRQRKSGIDHD